MKNIRIKQLIENEIRIIFGKFNEANNGGGENLIPNKDGQGEFHISTGDDQRFWGNNGAGILIIARNTGNMLLVLRSTMVNEPGTWGMPGGKIDDNDKSPLSAAKREVNEELGYSGELQIQPAHVFKAGNFQYYNFVGVVPEEFEATLDWENADYGWFPPNELPSPLHFGIQSLLSNLEEQIKNILK